MRRQPARFALPLLCSLAAAGCTDREIATYRVPKEPATAANPVEASAGNPEQTPRAPGAAASVAPVARSVPAGLTWTAPAHWQLKPPAPMRRGSFAIRGAGDAEADLSIIAFPGAAGGLLDNVNRWRGQVNLPALEPGALETETDRLQVGTLNFTIVDFAGPAGTAETVAGETTRIVGAVVPVGEETWFFKLMGPDALVTREKPAFVNFLNTVRAQ